MAGTGNSGKLICVLGAAGGGRDKWKREKFGEIAGRYCHTVIAANEDPYDENPQAILDEIEAGFLKIYRSPLACAVNFYKILDRREAVKKALESAVAGDTVIITGKGAESVIMGPAGKRAPWDDRKTVREEIKKLQITNSKSQT